MSTEDRDDKDPLQSLIAEILEAEKSGNAVDRETLLKQHPDLALQDFFANHDRMKAAMDQEDPTLPPDGSGIDDLTIPPNPRGTEEEATMPPRGEGEDPTMPPTRQSSPEGAGVGKSLAQKVADGPLPTREAAELVEEICDAMAYAHERGVIHRDLKPANILVDINSQPKVTDFGLAKKTQADSNLTGTGQILGTPAYMPPEQASGNTDVGPLADVYSLGAILYCLLTGRPPFQAASPMDTLLQVLDRDPISPRALNP
jgi:serine/threonine protein kinase